jgi:hypothetical protein
VLFAQLLLTLILLAVCSFAPGFLVVRRLRWSGMEKLSGAIGLSLILLFLATWAVYLTGIASGYFLIAGACGVCAVIVARDAIRLFTGAKTRRGLIGFGVLFAWTLVVSAVIRNYSGAMWGGDWLEHFQRALYFLHHFPADTPIYGGYQLPARPPMMNLLATFFLALSSDRFEIFQLVFAFLNVLLILPCWMVARNLAPVRRWRIWPLIAILALNPAAMQNATYTWTKSLTAFYVITALAFYLAAWRKRDAARSTAAFLALAAGLLVHYSAGPYIVFFALHYLLFLFRHRPAKFKEFAAIAVCCGGLLLAWFGWSMATFGTTPTFASNTSVTTTQQIQGSNAAKIAGNVLDSVIPHGLYKPELFHAYDQPYALGGLRDNLFLLYQTNLILSMGSVGGLLVVCWLFTALRRRTGTSTAKFRAISGTLPDGRGSDQSHDREGVVPDIRNTSLGHSTSGGERAFWIGFLAVTLVLGLAVVGERDEYGVAHLTLLPVEFLGLTALAVRFCSSRRLAWIVVAGCALDFSLGIFLHARIQHLENTPRHTYYAGIGLSPQGFVIGAPGPDALGGAAWRNWMNKHEVKLCRQWLADAEAFHPEDPRLDPSRAALRSEIAGPLKEDETMWHGWFARHNGEVLMLGDHFGEGDGSTVLLAFGALALLWQLGKSADRVHPPGRDAPRTTQTPPKKRSRRSTT